MFQTWEGDTKLCYEFKFSYIRRTAVKTFARDLVFYDMRRFELLYIYASRNVLGNRVLEWGVSGNVAGLARFNA